MGTYELWSVFFTQLHLALVEQQNQHNNISIGISFPEYRYEQKKGGYLGTKLRVFAQDEFMLQQLDLTKWLSYLTDSIHCTEILEVPSNKVSKYVQYRRHHIKGSVEKLAKRRAKRHKISLDEAMKHFQHKINTSDLPYIRLKSITTKQLFRLCIEKREHNKLIHDGFGTYGLSNSSTVPEF